MGITTIDHFLLYSKNDHINILRKLQIRNFFFNISKSSYSDIVKNLGLNPDQFFEINKKI